MTPKQAIEAGQLVRALKDLAKERRDLASLKDDRIGFDDSLLVPRAVFRSMCDAGLAETRRRLKALGVQVPR